MFICGNNFCGGKLACSLTPTCISDIDHIAIQNGIFDDLYVTKATGFELTGDCPKTWDFDTVLYAKFNNSTSAGNIDWSLDTVSDLVLKSRPKGTFQWKTLYVKHIESYDDFEINYRDYFVPNRQVTQYAIVPALHGTEGEYSIVEKSVNFDKMFLIENGVVYGTPITDGFCDTTRNIPSANVELLNRKYPLFIRNTIANYDTGSCTGSFVPLDEDTCNFKLEPVYDYDRITYQRKVMDFICDGVPKILKLPDGRIWIIQVTPNPTDTAQQRYNNRQISFSWVEVGDVNSEEDLFYLGLSDVPEEWWNK